MAKDPRRRLKRYMHSCTRTLLFGASCCFSCFFCCCSDRVLCGTRPSEDPKARLKARQAIAPPPLPRKRPRALSLDEQADETPHGLWRTVTQTQKQTTIDQAASSPLMRLPLEIRLQIWREVVGGQVVHLTRSSKRLLGLQCHQPERENTLGHQCWGITTGEARSVAYFLGSGLECKAQPVGFVPLLQTCRQIYTESVDIAYKENVFDLVYVDTLIYMPRCLLPRRIQLIRRLRFTWIFYRSWMDADAQAPYDMATWKQACAALAALMGLQELRVDLHLRNAIWHRHLRPDFWMPLLCALDSIAAPRKFEVSVPTDADQCDAMAKGMAFPFRLLSNGDGTGRVST